MTRPPFPVPSSGERVGDFLVLHPIRSPVPGDLCLRMFLSLDLGELEEVGLIVRYGDAADAEPFLADLAAARRLSHPGVPLVCGGGQEDDRFWIANTWVPGVILADLVADGPLPPEVAVRILSEIASALAALHGAGLVHGDLHPRNVLVRPEGGIRLVGYVPRPFGLPMPTHSPEKRIARYSAPEWNRTGELGLAADVYALGAVGYELLAGRPLFEPGGVQQLLEAQDAMGSARAELAKVAGALPALVDLLDSMLAPAPGDRPPCDADLARKLAEAAPSWTAERSLAALLGATFVNAVARNRRALIHAARRALEEDRSLVAGSCLRRIGELPLEADEGSREECAELVTHCLWDTFRIQDPTRYGHLGPGLGLELLRAAEGLGSRTLTRVARERLAFLAKDNQVFGRYATAHAPGDPARERRRLVDWVTKRPWDDTALLLLATLTDDFHPGADATVPEMQAAVLQANALHSAALFHRAKDLLSTSSGLPLLRDLQGLLYEAINQERSGKLSDSMASEESRAAGSPVSMPPPARRVDDPDDFFE